MTPFIERANDMGLDNSLSYKGLYSYEDIYSKVIYRVLGAQDTPVDDPNGPSHTDGAQTNLIGIWTSPADRNNYRYVGYVSSLYKFLGNQILTDRVRGSLVEVGTPILDTNTIIFQDYSALREETILRSSQNSAEVGDIHPVMIASNSYNGTRAASVGFGIAVDNGEIVGKTIFGFSLGEMKMIHVESSNTRLTSGINRYIEVFNNHILEMIDQSFHTRLTEDQMMGTLDIIEKYGKRKRAKIAEILETLQPPREEGSPPQLPSAWNVFLAIARYCALEPNLNMKRLLENVAENVLVVPQRMYEVLDKLERD